MLFKLCFLFTHTLKQNKCVLCTLCFLYTHTLKQSVNVQFRVWGMESASVSVVTSVSRHCYIKQTLHISPRWGGGSLLLPVHVIIDILWYDKHNQQFFWMQSTLLLEMSRLNIRLVLQNKSQWNSSKYFVTSSRHIFRGKLKLFEWDSNLKWERFMTNKDHQRNPFSSFGPGVRNLVKK